ncbi:hypothetical protein ACHAQA_006940 [Verticillium albo-atrum]
MKATTILSAIFLPALALAQAEGEKYDTSTTTATVTLTQTILLANVVETATFTASLNATALSSDIASATSDLGGAVSTDATATSSAPAQVTSGDESAGASLSASKMIMAGVAGMAALALM